jgi:hypothetical protein
MSLLFNNFPFIKYQNSKSRGFSSQSFPRTFLLSALAFALIVSLAAILVSQKPEYTPTTRATTLSLSPGKPKLIKLQRIARHTSCSKKALTNTKRQLGNKAARLHRLACQKTKVGIGIRGNKVVLALKLPPALQKNTTITAALKTGSSRRSPKRLTKARGKAGKQGWFRAVYRLDKNTRRFRLTGRIRINLSSSSRSTSLFLPLLPSALAQTNNPQRLVLPFVIVGRVKGGGGHKVRITFDLVNEEKYVGEQVDVSINGKIGDCSFPWMSISRREAHYVKYPDYISPLCEAEVSVEGANVWRREGDVYQGAAPGGAWVWVDVEVNPRQPELVKEAYFIVEGLKISADGVQWASEELENKKRKLDDWIQLHTLTRGGDNAVLAFSAYIRVHGRIQPNGNFRGAIWLSWHHTARTPSFVAFTGIAGYYDYVGKWIKVEPFGRKKSHIPYPTEKCNFYYSYENSRYESAPEYVEPECIYPVFDSNDESKEYTAEVIPEKPKLLQWAEWVAVKDVEIIEQVGQEGVEERVKTKVRYRITGPNPKIGWAYDAKGRDDFPDKHRVKVSIEGLQGRTAGLETLAGKKRVKVEKIEIHWGWPGVRVSVSGQSNKWHLVCIYNESFGMWVKEGPLVFSTCEADLPPFDDYRAYLKFYRKNPDTLEWEEIRGPTLILGTVWRSSLNDGVELVGSKKEGREEKIEGKREIEFKVKGDGEFSVGFKPSSIFEVRVNAEGVEKPYHAKVKGTVTWAGDSKRIDCIKGNRGECFANPIGPYSIDLEASFLPSFPIHFDSWEGCPKAIGMSCVGSNIKGDLTVTANFEPSGGGSGDGGSTPPPDGGYGGGGWNNGGSGGQGGSSGGGDNQTDGGGTPMPGYP